MLTSTFLWSSVPIPESPPLPACDNTTRCAIPGRPHGETLIRPPRVGAGLLVQGIRGAYVRCTVGHGDAVTDAMKGRGRFAMGPGAVAARAGGGGRAPGRPALVPPAEAPAPSSRPGTPPPAARSAPRRRHRSARRPPPTPTAERAPPPPGPPRRPRPGPRRLRGCSRRCVSLSRRRARRPCARCVAWHAVWVCRACHRRAGCTGRGRTAQEATATSLPHGVLLEDKWTKGVRPA